MEEEKTENSKDMKIAIGLLWLNIGLSALSILADKLTDNINYNDFIGGIISLGILCILPYKLTKGSNPARYIYAVIYAASLIIMIGSPKTILIGKFSAATSLGNMLIDGYIVYLLFKKENNSWFTKQAKQSYSFEEKSNSSKFIKYTVSVIGAIAFFSIAMNFVNIGTQKTIENLGNNALVQQQKLQQKNIQRAEIDQAKAKWQAEQEAIKTAAQQQIKTPQLHYEQRIETPKSAEECFKGNIITNETLRCIKGQQKTGIVRGNQ